MINIESFTNEELNWNGDIDWCIQINYKNLYYTNIAGNVRSQSTIINYSNISLDKHKNLPKNLTEHYHILRGTKIDKII